MEVEDGKSWFSVQVLTFHAIPSKKKFYQLDPTQPMEEKIVKDDFSV